MNSIYHRIGEPLTVSVYNPPVHFWEALDKLNSKELVLKNWSLLNSPWEADVWVFFVSDAAELQNHQPMVSQLYTKASGQNTGSVSYYIEFELEGAIAKAASFQILDNFGSISEAQLSCRAALAVYGATSGLLEGEERAALSQACNKL